MAECSAATRSKVYEAMLETMVRLHSTDWKGCGLESFFKGQNFLERQV